MTSTPFRDSVAIDTNVFAHLLNPNNNPDRHINKVLEHLQAHGISLIVDEQGRIEREYACHIIPMLTGRSVKGNELYILRHWMGPPLRLRVPVDRSDRLMTAIRQIIVEDSKNIDRTFVYVALKNGSILISNDETDIVFGPAREKRLRRAPRGRRLVDDTNKLRPPGANILTSREAFQNI